MEISRVDKQQIHTEPVCLSFHLSDEISEVAKIGTVVLIQQVTSEPSMSVSGVEKIELAPVQVFDLLGRSPQGLRLDSFTKFMSSHQVMVEIASKNRRSPVMVFTGTNLKRAEQRSGCE